MKKIVLLIVIAALVIGGVIAGVVLLNREGNEIDGAEINESEINESEQPDTDGGDETTVPHEYSKGLVFEEYENYCVLIDIGECTDVDIYIPDTYNGKPVTQIAPISLRNRYNNIKSITIPDTVTYIAPSAFQGWSSITAINLPKNIKEIDIGVFAWAENLEAIVLPESLEAITGQYLSLFDTDKNYVNKYENGLYIGTKKNPYFALVGIENGDTIKEFNVHKDTKIIAGGALWCMGATSVETINISDSVEYIGHDAFRNCLSLKSINIPKSVKYIGQEAFDWCTSLTSITIPDSIEFVGSVLTMNLPNLKFNEYKNGYYLGNSKNPYVALVGVKDREATSFEIHKNTKVIGALAVNGCKNLVSIDIPDSVTNICNRAFQNCFKLSSVTLSNSLEELGYMAFWCCDNIQKIVVPSSVKKISQVVSKSGSMVMEEAPVDIYFEGTLKEWLEIEFESPYSTNVGDLYINNRLVTEVVIPNGVKSIGNFAFARFGKIKTVTIPGSVTEIGAQAFSDCASLESVNIPDSVTKIGGYAFSGCTSLKSIEIPNSITNLRGTFSGCTSLESVVIPNSVTVLDWTFNGCTSLESVVIPNSVTVLDGAFNGCASLESVVIPNSVTVLDGAFNGCTSLKSVIIPDSVTAIGKETFKDCTSLENVSIPDSVVSISPDAFDNCTSLKYTVENNVYYLGNEGNPYFYLVRCDDTTITKFTIPNQTRVVHPDAFENCEALVEINIPEFVSDISYFNWFDFNRIIPSYKPWNLSELHVDNKYFALIDGNLYSKDGSALIRYIGVEGEESFAVPETVTVIKSTAFAGNNTLSSITMSDSVKKIEANTFLGCRKLKSIELSKSITRIEMETFRYCISLESITIPDSVTEIKAYAFAGCSSLASVELGESVAVIPQNAFYGCSALSEIAIPDSVRSIDAYAFKGCKGLKVLKIGNCDLSIGMEAFAKCSALENLVISSGAKISCNRQTFIECNINRIDFNGTMEEWAVVGKSFTMQVIGNAYTVYCTDGTITKK